MRKIPALSLLLSFAGTVLLLEVLHRLLGSNVMAKNIEQEIALEWAACLFIQLHGFTVIPSKTGVIDTFPYRRSVAQPI